MARGESPRHRRSSIAFGAYVPILLFLAYLMVDRVPPGWYDVSEVRWAFAGFMVLGSVVLVGVCAGAVARQRRLDVRIAELEAAIFRESAATPTAPPRPRARASRPRPPLGPEAAERDVEELLSGLHELSAAGAASLDPGEVSDPAESAGIALAELDWLIAARNSVARDAAGPAAVSVVLVGAFASFLPAADGMLLVDTWLNTFLVLVGTGILIGLLGYAAAAFRRLPR